MKKLITIAAVIAALVSGPAIANAATNHSSHSSLGWVQDHAKGYER